MTEHWLPEAALEIDQIINYYSMRDPGEELRFVDHLTAGIDRVMRNPTQPRKFDSPFRRVSLNVFPHQLIYVIEDDSVVFVAVAHPSQPKGYWKERY